MELALFVLPLALDTFAVSAALGIARLTRRRRLELALLMTSFELAMPIVGLLAGHGVGGAVGDAAHYVAVAALVALGVYMLVDGDERCARTCTGWIGLGVSISLDELAIGFSFGLLHVSVVWALVLIAVQAFVAAQLGLWLGARVGEALRRARGAGRRPRSDRARDSRIGGLEELRLGGSARADVRAAELRDRCGRAACAG